jgi:Flp pilus assembly protein TadG
LQQIFREQGARNVPATTKTPRLNKGLRGFLRRLATGGRDESGAAAVFFAVSLILLAPLTLGMMDVYVNSSQRNQLQDALDAATLFAARSTASTTTAIDQLGDKSLASNLVLPADVTLVASNFTLTGNTVTGYAEITPSAIAPGLWPHANIKANATVVRSVDRLEIALVLDNTGSMAGTKLTTLKSAGASLIDKLVAAAARSTDPTPLKVSLVPFSMTVRVQGSTPTTNYNTTTHTGTGFPTAWIDPQGTASVNAAASGGYDTFDVKTDRFTMLKQMNKQPWDGCVESRRQPYDVQEDAPTTLTPATMFTPYFWPDEPDNSTAGANNYQADAGGTTWKAKEQKSSKYSTALTRTGTFMSGYSYGPNSGCTMQPVIRLTTDTASIKTAISNMNAVGDTNIPMGLVWGWHTLSPNAPFADGSSYSTQHLKKVVILMTDGENTMTNPGSSNANGSYYSGLGYIWQNIMQGLTSSSSSTARQNAMDARLALLCTNMKAKNIIIYTVRVEVTSGTSTVLQNCASGPDKFYDVQDVSQLGVAFDSIAGSIDNLRISK